MSCFSIKQAYLVVQKTGLPTSSGQWVNHLARSVKHWTVVPKVLGSFPAEARKMFLLIQVQTFTDSKLYTQHSQLRIFHTSTMSNVAHSFRNHYFKPQWLITKIFAFLCNLPLSILRYTQGDNLETRDPLPYILNQLIF